MTMSMGLTRSRHLSPLKCLTSSHASWTLILTECSEHPCDYFNRNTSDNRHNHRQISTLVSPTTNNCTLKTRVLATHMHARHRVAWWHVHVPRSCWTCANMVGEVTHPPFA